MARILAIDYGAKRTGLAVTDSMQIVATGLAGLHTKDLEAFIIDYFKREVVEKVIIGHPTNLDGSNTHATPLVQAFINRFVKLFPAIPIIKVDERYTSKWALDSLIETGVKKKDRRNKNLIDEVAATIILQHYLQSR